MTINPWQLEVDRKARAVLRLKSTQRISLDMTYIRTAEIMGRGGRTDCLETCLYKLYELYTETSSTAPRIPDPHNVEGRCMVDRVVHVPL